MSPATAGPCARRAPIDWLKGVNSLDEFVADRFPSYRRLPASGGQAAEKRGKARVVGFLDGQREAPLGQAEGISIKLDNNCSSGCGSHYIWLFSSPGTSLAVCAQRSVAK
jgi:hypothetical protein